MNLHQAYLWIGPEEATHAHALSFMQRHFCAHGGCTICVDCRALAEHRYHALTWLEPDGTYTIKQFEGLHKTVSFSLEKDAVHFIVINRADLCNATCANSLLKILEEPLPGYHYLLLAPRKEGILPTISSRCVLDYLASTDEVQHRLLHFFTDYRFSQAPDLVKELEKVRVPEHEIAHLLDAILQYWHKERLQALQDSNNVLAQRAKEFEDLIEKAYEKLPMPGSSTLFLKNLFLQCSLIV